MMSIHTIVHFVDEKFELNSCCLQTAYFPDDQLGENIALGLRGALAAWDLCEDRQVSITKDNGTNIVKSVELIQWTRIQCLGHRHNLTIENALKDNAQCINRAIGICRKIVGHFSHSWKKRVALREAQQELNIPEHAMVTDCSTRWCSTQKMIARVLEQQSALSKVLSIECTTGPRASLSTIFDPMAQFREAVAAEHIYMPCVDHGEDPLRCKLPLAMQTSTEISVYTSNKLCIRESF
ncbi:zinc finger BED domain-containing protein 1-like [Tachysurus ichikawai]